MTSRGIKVSAIPGKMKHGICKTFSANVTDLVKINMTSEI